MNFTRIFAKKTRKNPCKSTYRNSKPCISKVRAPRGCVSRGLAVPQLELGYFNNLKSLKCIIKTTGHEV